MKNLEKLNVQKLTKEEMTSINGGRIFIRFSGFFDGIKGNTCVRIGDSETNRTYIKLGNGC